ncbi:MAG: SMI1/KNR4 family protein [Pirellulales bacterium]|nr:SMI1/KNR4 family protein [Pirellulales bacterium]
MAKICVRFGKARVDDRDDALRLLHQPWEGPESYAFWVFPPAKKRDFKTYQKLHQIKIPEIYREFLLLSNGFQAFDLDLFGMSYGMLKDPPLLDRSGFQCLDLSTANRTEKHSYEVDPEWLMFGGRCYSDNENCGYFLSETGAISSYLEGGKKVQQWRSFERFLASEIAAAEKFARMEYPEEWNQVDKDMI